MRLRQQGMIEWLLAVLLVPPLTFGFSFLVPAEPWDDTPRKIDRGLVFDPHHEFHPNHYSTDEKLAMLEKISLITMTTSPQHIGSMPGFWSFRNMNSVGSLAPEFDLPTTDGDRIRLADGGGRVSVFMFVAMTCPPARLQVDRWEAFLERYDPARVRVFFVYSRERHPGEPGYRNFKHTETDEEKMTYARLLAARTHVPIAVDDIAETTLSAYGKVPNAAFVVDGERRIVFKSTWADADKVERVVDRLLAYQPARGAEISGPSGTGPTR